jgi:hypothetical protein
MTCHPPQGLESGVILKGRPVLDAFAVVVHQVMDGHRMSSR